MEMELQDNVHNSKKIQPTAPSNPAIISKVRLKWIKNRGLDHIIDQHTDLKASSILQTAIHHSPTKFITSRTLAQFQKPLNLTIPTLRFIRRYPTLFHEFPHPKYSSLPCFRLTPLAQLLQSPEDQIHQDNELGIVEKLCRVLMMSKNGVLPLQSIHPLKWDLGLPHDLNKNFYLLMGY